MIFTVFWVATQAARINSAEMAIEANRLQTVEIRAYVRDFASRVDRQETPLARHVVDLEKNINILDDRIRALSERVTALERK
jgi:predicted  nucleic acid-binding Zn-ribbon protein